MKTFLIKYCIYYSDDSFHNKEMKIKNCMSEMHAKVKLEEYLKKHNSNFQKLVVYSATEDVLGIFGDAFNWWKK